MENEKLDKILLALDGLESKVEGLDSKFDGLDSKFEGLESKFEGLDSKFDGLNSKFEGLNSKFDGLELKVDSNTAMLEKVAVEVVNIKEVINDKLVTKKEFNQKIDGLFEHVEGLAGKQKVFDSELSAGISRSDRLEKRVTSIEVKIAV